MKLTESVHLVGSGANGIGLTSPYDCNVYYIVCGTEGILIDSGSGCASERIIREVNAADPQTRPITRLLLTHHHGDHAGGARDLRFRYGCQVLAPREEADSIIQGDEAAMGLDVARRAGFYPEDYHFSPCPVDFRVSPGETLQAGGVSIRVLDGAGHSLGGVCYYLQLDGRNMLFVGDLLSFRGLISLQNIPGADVARYSKSVLALEGLPVDCFFPGHGCFSLSGGDAHIRAAAAAFKKLGIPKNAV